MNTKHRSAKNRQDSWPRLLTNQSRDETVTRVHVQGPQTLSKGALPFFLLLLLFLTALFALGCDGSNELEACELFPRQSSSSSLSTFSLSLSPPSTPLHTLHRAPATPPRVTTTTRLARCCTCCEHNAPHSPHLLTCCVLQAWGGGRGGAWG